jgi:hypothetical protein
MVAGTVVIRKNLVNPAVEIAIEQFSEGYVWVIKTADGNYMNRRLYTSANGAMNAAKKEAAKLV